MQAMLLAPVMCAMTLAIVDGKSLVRKVSMDNQTLIRFGSFFVVIVIFLGAVTVAVTDLIRDPNAVLPVGIVTVLTSALTFAIHTLGVNLGSNITGSTNGGQNGVTIPVASPPTSNVSPSWIPLTNTPIAVPMQHTGVGDGPVS